MDGGGSMRPLFGGYPFQGWWYKYYYLKFYALKKLLRSEKFFT